MGNEIKDYVPANRSSSKKIGRYIYTRRLIEAIISVSIIGTAIWIPPFIFRAKIIFTLVFCGLAIVFNLVGIRNKSISQALYLWGRHIVTKRGMRLGSVNDEIKNSKFKQSNEFFEKIVAFWDDKNLTTDDESEGDIKKQLARFLKECARNLKSSLS